MKKILTLLLLMMTVITLASCDNTSTDATTVATTVASTTVTTTASPEPLTIIAPNGAPALSQLFVQDNDNYIVDVVNGEDPLIAALGSESHDFVFCATNTAAKLYKSGIDYQFLAAITFGNLFLVSMQESAFTLDSLDGKEIILFGQNASPDIILKYILQEAEVTATLTYVDSVASANAMFIADNTKIIMSAEPLLSILSLNVRGYKILDLQQAYKDVTGEDSYPQAGVFGKTDLTNEQINQFLYDLEESVTKVNEDIDTTVAKALELEYPFPEAVLRASIPNSNIGFVPALEVKDDLESFFNIILGMNGTLIGGSLPDDGFYYVP